jgi:hypothetical protein
MQSTIREPGEPISALPVARDFKCEAGTFDDMLRCLTDPLLGELLADVRLLELPVDPATVDHDGWFPRVADLAHERHINADQFVFRVDQTYPGRCIFPASIPGLDDSRGWLLNGVAIYDQAPYDGLEYRVYVYHPEDYWLVFADDVVSAVDVDAVAALLDGDVETSRVIYLSYRRAPEDTVPLAVPA